MLFPLTKCYTFMFQFWLVNILFARNHASQVTDDDRHTLLLHSITSATGHSQGVEEIYHPESGKCIGDAFSFHTHIWVARLTPNFQKQSRSGERPKTSASKTWSRSFRVAEEAHQPPTIPLLCVEQIQLYRFNLWPVKLTTEYKRDFSA